MTVKTFVVRLLDDNILQSGTIWNGLAEGKILC